MSSFSRYQVATAIAVLFHIVGIVGILFVDKALLIQTSFFHLLLMAVLVFYTQNKIETKFLFFFLICFITGMGVEWYGTATGELFGNYKYGTALGPAFRGVPFIIGVNWFILMYCCGTAVQMLFDKIAEKAEGAITIKRNLMHNISLTIDGALLAVLTDYFLEPAAVKLGYWQWLGDGSIPFYNYICWFVISFFLMAVFRLLKLYTKNIFAVNLLLIQVMFFLIISTFL